jgi:hypothetical protein
MHCAVQSRNARSTGAVKTSHFTGTAGHCISGAPPRAIADNDTNNRYYVATDLNPFFPEAACIIHQWWIRQIFVFAAKDESASTGWPLALLVGDRCSRGARDRSTGIGRTPSVVQRIRAAPCICTESVRYQYKVGNGSCVLQTSSNCLALIAQYLCYAYSQFLNQVDILRRHVVRLLPIRANGPQHHRHVSLLWH